MIVPTTYDRLTSKFYGHKSVVLYQCDSPKDGDPKITRLDAVVTESFVTSWRGSNDETETHGPLFFIE